METATPWSINWVIIFTVFSTMALATKIEEQSFPADWMTCGIPSGNALDLAQPKMEGQASNRNTDPEHLLDLPAINSHKFLDTLGCKI